MKKKTCILTELHSGSRAREDSRWRPFPARLAFLCHTCETPASYRMNQLINLPLLETAKHDIAILKPPFCMIGTECFPETFKIKIYGISRSTVWRGQGAASKRRLEFGQTRQKFCFLFINTVCFIICKALKNTCTSSILYKSMIQNKAFHLCWVFMLSVSVCLCVKVCVYMCTHFNVLFCLPIKRLQKQT